MKRERERGGGETLIRQWKIKTLPVTKNHNILLLP